MSQVQIKKYESGGTSEKPKVRTIKRGNDDIDLDKYIRNLEHNFDSWINSRDLNDKEKELVRAAYRDMLNGYNDGTITAGLGNQSHDSSSKRKNAEKGFDAYGRALDYFNTILLHLSVYTKPSKAKFDRSKSWNDYLGKLSIDYNLFRLMTLDELNLYLSNLLADYTGSIKGDDYEDYDSNYGQSVINLFNSAISDPDLTAKERMDLSSVGIDLSKFYPTAEPEKEKTEAEKAQEDLLAAQTEAMTLEAKRLADLLRRRTSLYNVPDVDMRLDLSKYTTPYRDYKFVRGDAEEHRLRFYNEILPIFDNFINTNNVYRYSKDFWDKPWSHGSFGITKNLKYKNPDGTEWQEFDPKWTNGLLFRYIMDNIYSPNHESHNKGPMPRTLDGHLIMGTTDGYSRLYNPRGIMYNTASRNIPGLIDEMPEFAEFKVYSNKEGGVLKAQFGMVFNEPVKSYDLLKAEQAEAKRKAEEDKLKDEADKAGKTIDQYKAGQRKPGEEGFTSVDYARMGAIVGDITSMLSAWVPGYGTAVSAATGVASTLTNLGADIADDSVSTWDAIKGLGIGLAMDAVGLIPGFGGAGKTAKITKTVVKYIPRIMTLANAGAIALDSETQKSFSKFGTDESLTVLDWRNVARAFLAAAGVSRMGAALMKASAMKAQAKATTSTSKAASILTKNGELTVGKEITPELFAQLKGAKSAKEANTILLSIEGLKDNSFISTTRIGINPLNVKVKRGAFRDQVDETTYDFSGVAPRFGSLNDRWSDVSIFSRAYNATSAPHSWNPYNWWIKLPIKRNLPGTLTPVNMLSSTTNTRVTSRVTPGSGPNPKSIAGFKTPALAKARGYKRDFAIGTGPNARERALGIVYDLRGGKLPFKYASGGQIPKYSPGGSVTNTSYGGNYSWDNIIYNTDYFKNTLKGINLSNYEAANKLLNRFYTDKINNDWNNKSINYRDEVKSYQTDFNNAYGTNLNSGAIESAISNGLITRVGRTGDTTSGNYADGYTGAMTNLRHLGTSEHSKYLGAMNEILKTLGLEAFVNPKTNMINYRPISTQNNPPVLNTPYASSIDTLFNDEQSSEQDNIARIIGRHTAEKIGKRDPLEGAYLTLYPKALSLGRLIGTLSTNSSIYDTMRKGIQPDFINTYELYSPVTGAFSVMQFLNNKAALLRSQASTPYTSDARLNLARQLEGNKLAIDLERQGLLADDLEIKRTKAEALKRQEDNIARRTDVANKNRLSLNQHLRTLALLKSDYKLKNWNAIAGFLGERQLEANQNLSDYRNFVLKVELDRAKQAYEDAIYPEKQALNELIRSHANDPTFDYTLDPVYDQYMQKARLAGIDLNNAYNKSIAGLYGWGFTPITRSWHYTDVK